MSWIAWLVSILAVVGMAGCLLLVPLGIPGTWLMLGILLGGVLAGQVGWGAYLALAGVAGVAELVELGLVKVFSVRYGGSRRAFWGAIVGGLVGLIVGMPVPVFGSLLAGLAGTFLGAALLTYTETRHAGSAARVGWGTLLARVLAAGVKTAAGIVVLAVGSGALLFD